MDHAGAVVSGETDSPRKDDTMGLHLNRFLVRMIAVAAVCAFSAPTIAQAGGGTVHAAKHHHRKHHHIPQHNGGDHDADNRGGPSDGDGNT
jgi:hypothetical protein